MALAKAAGRPKLNAEGEWRYETVHHMGRRCLTWDYRQRAYYEITLTLEDRASQALGRLEVRGRTPRGARAGQAAVSAWVSVEAAKGPGLTPELIEARVVRSVLGEAIFAHFRRIGEFTPEMRPVYCEIMPDHLHFIVEVLREMARPLGNAIGGFKTGCEKIFASQGGKGRLFRPGFVDEILFHQGQLGNWFNYLRDNPRRRAIKRLFPGLFRNVRELAVDLWLAPQTPDGGGAAGLAARVAVAEGGSLGSALRAPARGWFSALGNLFLLQRSLAQVQVSRSDFGYRREPKPGGRGLKISREASGEPKVDFASPLYAEKKAALFAVAKHGAVLISPCVSDGERQIAREALAAGLPLVTLQNKGFSSLEKPAGRYFDACADGRLLMLAPVAWPYRPGEKPMTRLDAAAMNRLCQWIAGAGAVEINYRGMRPENVDALAVAAAQVVAVGPNMV